MDQEKEAENLSVDSMMQEFEQIASETDEDTTEFAAVFSSIAQDDSKEPTTVFVAPVESADDTAVFPIAEENAQEQTVVFAAADASAVFAAAAAEPEEPTAVFSPAESEAPTSTVVFSVPDKEDAAQTTEDTMTRRLEQLSFAKSGEPAKKEPTMRVVTPGKKEEPAAGNKNDGPIPLSRSERLRELKRKIVAGPEKQFYTLNGIGVGKLQIAIILNLIILALCCVAIVMFTTGKVHTNRMKLMIFSQVLAMLVSGLLGCNLMMDGLSDLFRLRYSLNSTLVISFIACCVDAWFCLDEYRVPCCGAFVVEMIMALTARYHKRSTEMSQMDTLRKASQLTSLVKEPKYYEKYTGILRGQGDVEDFMDTYARVSGPEIVQRVFAFIALIACIGIAVLAGLLHGTSLAVQVFAASLMVATPASYFVALTRPAALLEKRLHMVGTVLCGWQGVKKLCGRAVFPLRDKDLFPRGSTKLNGIKFYSDRPPAEVVSYTASLIFQAGGGLVPLFRNLLNSRNGVESPVENFRDYGNGGIGGEVNGEPVLLGSQEFLESMGVEIPKGTMVSQAIYVSIDGQLAAVIAISYAKMRSAAAGIVSLCSHWKLKPLLLAGDFMLTDSFIREKFSIRTRRLIVPSEEVRSTLSAHTPSPDADVLALVTRDDLSAAVYAVTGSMALRTACRIGSLIHILGGIAGIVAMVLLAYLGAFELLTPAHVMLYQLVWLIPGWLATEWTRVV